MTVTPITNIPTPSYPKFNVPNLRCSQMTDKTVAKLRANPADLDCHYEDWTGVPIFSQKGYQCNELLTHKSVYALKS